MRAIRYHEHGGTEVLSIDDIERPEPGFDELLVDNRAVGINHVDTLFREGIFTPASLPAIPGSDFAGVVAGVGEGVTDYEAGDRVHGAGLGGSRQGSYAEYVTVPTNQAAPLPDAVGFLEGAAMGHVGVAAWQAVVHHGRLEPAETCLIHGGGGGVGHIAVQLAAAAGGIVITTEAAEDTRRRLEELGADATFDFRRDDLADAILGVAEPPDLIVDYHFDNYIDFDVRNIAHGGRISVLEFTGEQGGEAVLEQSAFREGVLKDVDIQLVGIFNGDIDAVLRRLSTLVAEGELDIEIAERYDLHEAAQAQLDIVEETHYGKLVFDLT